MKLLSLRRSSIVTALMLFVGALVPLQSVAADPVTPDHTVSCKANINQPTRGLSTVGFDAYVNCTGSVDYAKTIWQLQIFENGRWRFYGNPVTSYSTAASLYNYDSAGLKPGFWRYRGTVTRDACHHNCIYGDFVPGPIAGFTY